uniref:Uncharacterized protein n=1 Tax=Oryza nivara TaxID=4536 RepID=A0A0E0H5M7_ORYNI
MEASEITTERNNALRYGDFFSLRSSYIAVISVITLGISSCTKWSHYNCYGNNGHKEMVPSNALEYVQLIGLPSIEFIEYLRMKKDNKNGESNRKSNHSNEGGNTVQANLLQNNKFMSTHELVQKSTSCKIKPAKDGKHRDRLQSSNIPPAQLCYD